MRVVPENCDKFYILETKRAVSARLADILTIRIRGIVSKFHENIYTNSVVTSITSGQHAIHWHRCRLKMHNLSDVIGIFPYRFPCCLLRYISSLFSPSYVAFMEKIEARSKIEYPHSIMNYLPQKSKDIMKILLILLAMDFVLQLD